MQLDNSHLTQKLSATFIFDKFPENYLRLLGNVISSECTACRLLFMVVAVMDKALVFSLLRIIKRCTSIDISLSPRHS